MSGLLDLVDDLDRAAIRVRSQAAAVAGFGVCLVREQLAVARARTAYQRTVGDEVLAAAEGFLRGAVFRWEELQIERDELEARLRGRGRELTEMQEMGGRG